MQKVARERCGAQTRLRVLNYYVNEVFRKYRTTSGDAIGILVSRIIPLVEAAYPDKCREFDEQKTKNFALRQDVERKFAQEVKHAFCEINDEIRRYGVDEKSEIKKFLNKIENTLAGRLVESSDGASVFRVYLYPSNYEVAFEQINFLLLRLLKFEGYDEIVKKHAVIKTKREYVLSTQEDGLGLRECPNCGYSYKRKDLLPGKNICQLCGEESLFSEYRSPYVISDVRYIESFFYAPTISELVKFRSGIIGDNGSTDDLTWRLWAFLSMVCLNWQGNRDFFRKKKLVHELKRFCKKQAVGDDLSRKAKQSAELLELHDMWVGVQSVKNRRYKKKLWPELHLETVDASLELLLLSIDSDAFDGLHGELPMPYAIEIMYKDSAGKIQIELEVEWERGVVEKFILHRFQEIRFQDLCDAVKQLIDRPQEDIEFPIDEHKTVTDLLCRVGLCGPIGEVFVCKKDNRRAFLRCVRVIIDSNTWSPPGNKNNFLKRLRAQIQELEHIGWSKLPDLGKRK